MIYGMVNCSSSPKVMKIEQRSSPVKKNLQLDWTKKEDAHAAICLAVKKELRGKVMKLSK